MTSTIDAAVFLLLLAGLALLAAVLVCGLVLAIYGAPLSGLRDRWRSAWYVLEYDRSLEWLGVPSKQVKELRNELRRNIADAVAEQSVSAALAGLGPARQLAHDVGAGPRRPVWARGVAAGAVVFVLLQVAAFGALDAVVSALESTGTAGLDATASTLILPGFTFTVTTGAGGTADVIGMQQTFAALLLPVLAFLLWSRPWRAIGVRRARVAA